MPPVPKPTKGKRMPKEPKIKLPKVTALKKDCHFIYSWHVRLNGSRGGYNTCYTCGKTYPVLDIQCGHYHSRKNNVITYYERNTKPQCQDCNLWKKGAPQEYAQHLVQEYGASILDDLARVKNTTVRWKAPDLMKMIETYKILVRQKLKEQPETKVSARLEKFIREEA
jgi:hypothetical protein